MSMTREEAIAVLAESKRQNEVMRDNPSTFWASHQMADGVKNAERRIAALDMALSALRPVSREQVEKVWRGCRSCKGCRSCVYSIHDLKDMPCKKCDPNAEGIVTEYKPSNFCSVCGKPLTDEAVQMVMERVEALYEQKV